MTRRPKFWLFGSLLFALVNAAGGIYAVVLGEGGHAAVHGALLLVGLYVAWRVGPRGGVEVAQAVPLFDQRLERIEQSLDAIAVEVERVEEGQRYVMKLGQQMDEKKAPL